MKLRALLETPIDDGAEMHTTKSWFSSHTKMDFKKTTKSFSKTYQVLGKGSSRIAFSAPMNIDVFKADDLTNVSQKDGKADTVIKLAFNEKGLAQNIEELKLWHLAKQLGHETLLCPIIDWAGNPAYKNDTKYVIDGQNFAAKNGDKKAPFWIQLAAVKQLTSDAQLSKLFEDEFGFSIEELRLLALHAKQTGKKNYTKSNASEFLRMCDSLKMSAGDLFAYENWGLLKGNLVIIDYGLTDANEHLYDSEAGDVKIYSSVENGEVTIRI
jgi:hypothetical protein